MNETLPFLAVNYMFVCQRRDGEDVGTFGFWRPSAFFSFREWDPDMEA